MHLETELMTNLREKAEVDAIHVFARNLKDLLLAAPAFTRTMGLDPACVLALKSLGRRHWQSGRLHHDDPHQPHVMIGMALCTFGSSLRSIMCL